MSFKTDEPFAPYRVPKSNRTKTESLEIYFISDQPYGGFVQNQRQNIDEWCARVRDHHHRSLSGNFKEQVQIPSGWVATYMKADFPTDAPDDLVFRPVNKGVFEMGSYTSPLEYAAWIGGSLIVVGCVVVLFRSRGIRKGGAKTLNS
ncbi:MAG TPA: hypothetical protein VK171_03195 [Fimbriimonas sp.]|nr:hypothetical protein [Fimbriimonas sp.]